MKTWIKQSPRSHNCGQIAVAVIAGISLDQSVKLIGKKGCTKTKDLTKALRILGYKCPNRLIKSPRPFLGIAHLRYPNENRSHYVVVEGDKIYDGIYGDKNGNVKWKKGWKLTSYLPVYEKSN